MSECALTRGYDIHRYETRGRDDYQTGVPHTGRQRTVVCEHLPSPADVDFTNRLPNSLKNAQTPKALKLVLP